MKSAIQFKFQGKFSQTEKKLFKDTQIQDLIKICAYLQINPKSLGLIKYFVYDSHQGKIDADPNHSISRAVARYKENAVFRYWDRIEDSSFPHELTHLVAHHFYTPYYLNTQVDQADGTKLTVDIEMVSTVFMQEGLAIAVDDIVFIRKLKEQGGFKFIDDWCREQIKFMPKSLKNAMANFNNLPNEVIIPFTASFSKFLLTKFGLEKYKKVYCKLKETNPLEENIKIFTQIYNLDEKSIIKSWKLSLS